ncbi:MAG TPA: saccharopine dehydrogenase NADP-binding domain-containing protein [Ilumatobacter sp.]
MANDSTDQMLARISGPVVIIGFGSIGRGTLPLLDRHVAFDRDRCTVIEPSDDDRPVLDRYGVRYVSRHVTAENYRELLIPLLTEGGGQGFCINLSVDTSSLDIMRLCRELGVLYLDTVVEPWEGFYFDASTDNALRTNQALRATVIDERRRSPGGTTAVSCCGANPGMVSWFVKAALMRLAADLGRDVPEPAAGDRAGWARLMADLGVTGVHIAERDTQTTTRPKPLGVFWNTWSVDGFISEGLQPAELGWGTHERWMPANARTHDDPAAPGIFLEQPGAATRVRTWCPTFGAQHGFLVTHNEALSIPDFFTVWNDDGSVAYRPTCHYAYRPCDAAVVAFDELFGAAGRHPVESHVLDEHEIVDGADELGVLLYGHERNAMWFGSQLTIGEARALAPDQNATGLQVTSAVLAGVVWALEHPEEGIVETDDMDHRRCLEVQLPYLGNVDAFYTDWTPLTDRPGLFAEDLDREDPWQFRNVLVH